jgi:hypothetical protein
MSPEQLNDALWKFVGQIAFWYVVAAVVTSIANSYLAKHTDVGRDDTDPAHGRSDLRILTDHKTGCQYLAGSKGGLTPRLDQSGKHMCEQKEPE